MVKRDSNYISGNETEVILGVDEKNKISKELNKEKFKKSHCRHENSIEKLEEIYWDNTLKELLCKEFTIRSGKKVRKELKTIIDEEYKFMSCKVDRRIVGENSILLCTIYSGVSLWKEINEDIYLKCQHDMRVTKADKCYTACLINDKKFIFREVNRDEDIISKIIEKEKALYYNHASVCINGGQNQ